MTVALNQHTKFFCRKYNEYCQLRTVFCNKIIISVIEGVEFVTHRKPNVVLRVAGVKMLWQDMPQLRTSEIITRSVSVTNYSRYSINYRKHVIIWFIVLACNYWYPHFTHHQWHVELLSMITPWLSIKCLCSQIFLSHNSQPYTRPTHLNCALLTVCPQDLVLRSPSAGYLRHVTCTACTFLMPFYPILSSQLHKTMTTCSALLHPHLYLCLTMQCPDTKQVNTANFCTIL